MMGVQHRIIGGDKTNKWSFKGTCADELHSILDELHDFYDNKDFYSIAHRAFPVDTERNSRETTLEKASTEFKKTALLKAEFLECVLANGLYNREYHYLLLGMRFTALELIELYFSVEQFAKSFLKFLIEKLLENEELPSNWNKTRNQLNDAGIIYFDLKVLSHFTTHDFTDEVEVATLMQSSDLSRLIGLLTDEFEEHVDDVISEVRGEDMNEDITELEIDETLDDTQVFEGLVNGFLSRDYEAEHNVTYLVVERLKELLSEEDFDSVKTQVMGELKRIR